MTIFVTKRSTMGTILLLAISFALTACGGQAGREEANFGAPLVAEKILLAQQKCAAAGYDDLKLCSDAPRSQSDARLAARVAVEIQSTYFNGCSEAAGQARCDDMLMMAYVEAAAAASTPGK